MEYWLKIDVFQGSYGRNEKVKGKAIKMIKNISLSKGCQPTRLWCL